jgi:Ca-activated chloride channel family protein
VRYYVQRGLLPAPVFRGKDTVYGREHLLRLKGIKALQDRFLPLDAIQAELERRDEKGLEELAAGTGGGSAGTKTVTAPDAYDFPGEGQHPYRTPPPLVPHRPRPRPQLDAHVENWTRARLAPGVELHVSEDASDEALELADEIMRWVERRKGEGGK